MRLPIDLWIGGGRDWISYNRHNQKFLKREKEIAQIHYNEAWVDQETKSVQTENRQVQYRIEPLDGWPSYNLTVNEFSIRSSLKRINLILQNLALFQLSDSTLVSNVEKIGPSFTVVKQTQSIQIKVELQILKISHGFSSRESFYQGKKAIIELKQFLEKSIK